MAVRQAFVKSLEALYEQIYQMGSLVNSQIEDAVRSLATQDLELANQVVAGDIEINRLQSQLEDQCMLLIATQQPFAKDLRKIVAAFKISIYLERMGDLAVDMAKTTKRMSGEKLIKPLIDIPRMAEHVHEMIMKGLGAFQADDLETARAMALMDDEVDHLYSQIFRELLVFMMQDPKTINHATYLIFVGRFLERLGDYCTNIAEEIEYVVTGKRPDLN